TDEIAAELFKFSTSGIFASLGRHWRQALNEGFPLGCRPCRKPFVFLLLAHKRFSHLALVACRPGHCAAEWRPRARLAIRLERLLTSSSPSHAIMTRKNCTSCKGRAPQQIARGTCIRLAR